MNPNLLVHRITPNTPEWFEARKNLGIGASEAAACLNPSLHEYISPIRVFYEKVGMVSHRDTTNQFAFWGTVDEELIAKAWEYWDGTLDEEKNPNYVNNYKNEKRIRRCRRVNGIMQNAKYPWLFMSPDRLINKGMPTLDDSLLLTGPPLRTEAPLEVKTISRFNTNKWAIKIPIYYLVQVTIQMIILESDYAEMAIREDGNNLRVERIPYLPELADQIIKQTKAFWDNVKRGKVLYAQMWMSGNQKDKEECIAQLHLIEPGNDGSQDFKDFFSETFKQEIDVVPSIPSDFENAYRAKIMKAVINSAERKKLFYENNLLTRFCHEQAGGIDMGDNGYVKCYKKEGAKNYQLYNSVKLEVKDEIIDKIVDHNFLDI